MRFVVARYRSRESRIGPLSVKDKGAYLRFLIYAIRLWLDEVKEG